jgi:hypothetical protein
VWTPRLPQVHPILRARSLLPKQEQQVFDTNNAITINIQERVVGSLSADQVGEVLGLSPRTIRKDWVFAMAWLRRRMEQGPDV